MNNQLVYGDRDSEYTDQCSNLVKYEIKQRNQNDDTTPESILIEYL